MNIESYTPLRGGPPPLGEHQSSCSELHYRTLRAIYKPTILYLTNQRELNMPFVPYKDTPSPLALTEGFDLNPEPDAPRSVSETIGAAFRLENPVVSANSAFRFDGSQPFDPDLRPFDLIEGTEFEGFSSRFVAARTEDDVEQMKFQITQEMEDAATLQAAGGLGMLTSIGAAILSPTSFLPGGAVYKGVKGGVMIGKSAVSVGVAAGVAASIDEAILQSSQQIRTAEESAFAIGGSVILGGLLGGGAAKMSKRSFKHTAAIVENLPEQLTEYNDALRSIGAADPNVDMTVRKERVFQAIRKIPGIGLTTQSDPVLRMMLSDNHAARREGAKLIETPLQWQVNEVGQTVLNGDVSAETAIKTRRNIEMAGSVAEIRKGYADYVHDGPVGSIGRITAPLTGRYQHLASQGEKLTATGFRKEVGAALTNGDIHPIPQVQQVAQNLRKNLFDPAFKRGVDLGQFGEDLQLKNGKSYFTRVYQLDKIVKNWGNGTSDDFKKFLFNQFKRSRSEAEVRLSADRTVDNLKNDIAQNKESIRQSRLSLELAEGKARSKRNRADTAIKREESKLRLTEGLRNKFLKRQRDLIRKTTAGYNPKATPEWRKIDIELEDALGNKSTANAGRVSDDLETRSRSARELIDCFGSGLGFLSCARKNKISKTDAKLIKSNINALGDNELGVQAFLDGLSKETADLQQKLLDEGHAIDLDDGTPDLNFEQEVNFQIKAARQVLRNPPPDMLKAMRDLGGIKSGSDAGELKSVFDDGATTYRRTDGHDPDTMRSMLAEMGYLADDTSVADFWNAVRTNKDGDKIFSFQEHGVDIEAWEAAKAFSDTLDELGLDIKDASAKDIISSQTKIAQNEGNAKVKAGEAGRSAAKAGKAGASADDKILKAFKRLEESQERLDFLKKTVGPKVRDEIIQSRKNVSKLLPVLKKAKKLQSRDEFYIGMDDVELESAVDDVLVSLKGLKPGQHSSSVAMGNPTRARVLDFNDADAAAWLEQDAGTVAAQYFNSIVPDQEIIARFGDLGLTDAKAKINEEMHSQLSKATTEKQRAKITDEAEVRASELQAMADRLRGRYGVPDNPNDIWTRGVRSARTVSFMGHLGGMTISAIPDVSNLIGRGGIEAAFGSIEALTDPKRFQMSLKDANELGAAAEWYLNGRSVSLAEVADQYGATSKFDRFLSASSTAFSQATGMVAWNTAWKSVGSSLVSSKISKAAIAVKLDKASKKQLLALSENGIDLPMARRIADQLDRHGDMNGNLWLPQAGKWDDQQAFEAMRNMITREQDLLVVTPGQDKPLFMSTETGKFLGQFKSFIISANHRILLSGIQRADADVLAQFTTAVILGGLVSNVKADIGGYDRKSGAALWEDAFDKSGLSGWLMEAHGVVNSVSGGQLSFSGEEVSRFRSRSVARGLAGPTADMGMNILEATAAISRGDATSRDIHKLMKPIPGSNLPYIMPLFKKIEDRMGEFLGAKPRP